jgi:hypothetical protein
MKVVGAKVMTPAEIRDYVQRRLNRGIRSAGPFIVERLKAVVGIQAPRKRGGPNGWIATTRATPGAPPRRVSGLGQKSIYWRRTKKGGIAWGAKKPYMMILERKGHPWLHMTVRKYFAEVLQILGES